ncbi:MAG: sulfite reductase [Gammaproteobacteria bacterium]|nr:MAG: sulfite reductase [Gammaproteobacteria bacterium]
MANIYLAYGSQSGNARNLANTLATQLAEAGFVLVQFGELDDISPSALTDNDTLLIITSSFGDGEPPGNARKFYENLLAAKTVSCQFAVFGLGDISYSKFCGFSIEVDALLRDKGASSIAMRVDADTSFKDFFQCWTDAVIAYFKGDDSILEKLNLQVKVYSENESFPARIQSVRRLDSGEFPVYEIQIDITDSGINYQAGDLLYIVPPVNKHTLERIADFYGQLSEASRDKLGKKELRYLSKPLFRALVKLTNNEELKALTKMSASKQLADYCYGRDIADVLCDFFAPETLPIADLFAALSPQLPRAYSIASCGSVSPDTVTLCVREVAYNQNGNQYFGTASHFLAHSEIGTQVAVYVRANRHFHLPEDNRVPIILIGAGVGIAPYMGFLSCSRFGEAHLFFGDRYRAHDFLYQKELEEHLQNRRLTALYTTFSRDQAEKKYVQHLLQEHGEKIWQLAENKAEIYVCGSKAHLQKNIDKALCEIAQCHGQMGEHDAQQWLFNLTNSGRYHQDLY